MSIYIDVHKFISKMPDTFCKKQNKTKKKTIL